MSMASAKTIEIAGIRRPDPSKCQEVFRKYAKFYKTEDAVEILEAIANNVDIAKLFLELVDFQVIGRDLLGFTGKMMRFSSVPAYETQRKIVDVYDMMLPHITEEKELFINETLKKAIENGLVMLVIRVLEDIKATETLREYVKSYEEMHSKEEQIYEVRMDKVFRKQIRVKDGTMQEVIENAIAGKSCPDTGKFFKDSVGQGYEPKPLQVVLREAELSEYIHDEREMEIVEGLVCENPEWDRFYEKDLESSELLRMATEYYNWDDGTVIPYVIVKQKNCDKNTAKAIFDFADGDSYLAIEDPKPWNLEWIAFFRALKYQIEND